MAAETVVDFLQEARQSLEEVSYAIKEGKMSNTLPCDSSCVYLNLTTFEGLRFCVRLSLRGFEVHLLQLRSQLALHTLFPSQYTQPHPSHLSFKSVPINYSMD